MPFKHNREYSGKADHAKLEYNMIEPLAPELAVSGVMDGTWAEEMDKEKEYIADSEYIQASYPPVPSAAPWHPPYPP